MDGKEGRERDIKRKKGTNEGRKKGKMKRRKHEGNEKKQPAFLKFTVHNPNNYEDKDNDTFLMGSS